jgi:hypothetical protein
MKPLLQKCNFNGLKKQKRFLNFIILAFRIGLQIVNSLPNPVFVWTKLMLLLLMSIQ